MEVGVTVSDGGFLPEYSTDGSAGMDLRASESFEIGPMQRMVAKTGVRLAIPHGFEGQVRARSGLSLKLGLGVANGPGTIDSDYRGEVGVILINFSSDVVRIDRGERIAQLVFCPVQRVKLVQMTSLDETVRGEGGFGSTGTR